MLKLGFIAERMLAEMHRQFSSRLLGLLALDDKYGFDYEAAFKKKEVCEFITRRLIKLEDQNHQYRLIIILSCGEELTMREIGEALDLPESRSLPASLYNPFTAQEPSGEDPAKASGFPVSASAQPFSLR